MLAEGLVDGLTAPHLFATVAEKWVRTLLYLDDYDRIYPPPLLPDEMATTSVHYLSKTDIDEACQLASQGHQRLRSISKHERTVFHFAIPSNNHFAAVTITVLPQKGPRYPSYDVSAGYWPCCDNAESQPIENLIQLVYDTCILAVRRDFDGAWYVDLSSKMEIY